MTNEEIKNLAERIISGLASEDEIRLYTELYNKIESQPLGESSELPDFR